MIAYTIAAGRDEMLLLAGPDHWLIVSLVPGEPIYMTRFDSEDEALAAFNG